MRFLSVKEERDCIFLIPKAQGGFRPILDLHQLNQYLKKRVLQDHVGCDYPLPGDWYATLNLKDTYFHVVIYQGHRKYFRFLSSHYLFAVLPFNQSIVLWIFIECMMMVAAFLRRLGIQVYLCLDDWLVWSHSRIQLLSSVTLIQSTFNALGLLINSENVYPLAS